MTLQVSSGSSVRWFATDMCTAIVADAKMRVMTKGRALIPAKTLVDRVRAMPDGDVELSLYNGSDATKALNLQVFGGNRRLSVRCLSVDSALRLPESMDLQGGIEMPSGTLADLISATIAASSPDESRPHLSGILLEIEPGVVKATATNGHMLLHAEKPVNGESQALGILPKTLFPHLRKALAATKSVTVRFSVGDLVFRGAADGAHVSVITRTVLGDFPGYQRVIPKDMPHSAIIPRKLFAAAVKACASACDGKLIFEFGDDVRILSSKMEGQAVGDAATDKVPASMTFGVDGHGSRVGMDSTLLLSALACSESEEVRIEFAGELDPFKVTNVGDDSFVSVIMPCLL